MARLRKQIDEAKVEQLAAVRCSEKEIGQYSARSDDLLERRFESTLGRRALSDAPDGYALSYWQAEQIGEDQ